MKATLSALAVLMLLVEIIGFIASARSSGYAIASPTDNIGFVSSGTLLSLIIALSAYVATIRLFAIQRASALQQKATEKEDEAKTLAPADKAKEPLLKHQANELQYRAEELKF